MKRIAEVREVILGIVRGDVRFLTELMSEVVVVRLGDYYVKIELMVWMHDPRIHIPCAKSCERE